jgi:DNA-binding NarL/FixJ family response regulator
LLAGIRAVAAVAAGDAVVAPAMTRRLLATFTRQPGPGTAGDADRLAMLSAREREVLLDMASGLTNSEIAAHLVVSESTVKTHVSRVLAKTGARDRVHAVIIAYDAGLVRPAGH